MNIFWIVLAIIVLLILVIIATYNGLVRLNGRVDEAWSDITVQLKYRGDLIPNLVETVKGYAKHEKGTFEEITKARSATLGAKDPASASKAEQQMQAAITSLYAVAENYPELKANENFKELQGQLQDCEDKLQAARRYYNAGVKELNIKIDTIPTNLINAIFCHFDKRKYFDVEESERAKIEKAPNVKFD